MTGLAVEQERFRMVVLDCVQSNRERMGRSLHLGEGRAGKSRKISGNFLMGFHLHDSLQFLFF